MYSKFKELVESYESICIFRHTNPDGDALGSQNGLAQLIMDNYPDKVVHTFGDGHDALNIKFPESFPIDNQTVESSLVIICDTAVSKHIDGEQWKLGDHIIKIDHHPVVESFGTTNIEDVSKPATVEIVYDIARELGWTMSTQAAEFLYVGLITDTGRFRYRGVNQDTFTAAIETLQAGVDIVKIYDELYQREMKSVKFGSYVALNFELTDGVAHIFIPESVYTDFDIDKNSVKYHVGAMSGIVGVDIQVIAFERDDSVKVSIRSKNKKINHIAQRYDGGGHELASGAKVADEIEFNKLIAELAEENKNG